MNTGEILRAAAQRIRLGWCQGTMRDDNGGVCAIGAVCEVLFGDPMTLAWNDEHTSEYRDVSKVLVKPMRPVIGNIQVKDWNNAPEQTAENVAQGLEYAALLWEQEQAQRTEMAQMQTA